MPTAVPPYQEITQQFPHW